PNGGERHVRPKARAIFADAPAFLLDAAQFDCQCELLVGLARPPLRLGVEPGKMAADDFVRGVSLDPLGSAVPTGNIALRVERKEGVILHGFYQQPELLRLLSLRFVV